MLQIQQRVIAARIGDDIMLEDAREIAADYVCKVYGEPDAPTSVMLATELGKRVGVISRVIMAVANRLPEGQRNSAQVTYEFGPREMEVCWLVARGEIEVNTAGVQ
jgi:hypothetical protein